MEKWEQAWPIILTLLIAGGCGGLIVGIREKSSYPLTVPFWGREYNLGILGDIATGMATAVAIVCVGGALMGQPFEDVSHQSVGFVRLSAFGILAGVAGFKLLSDLSGKFANQLSAQEDKIEEIDEKVDKIQALNEALREAGLLRAQGKHMEAALYYERALHIDQNNEEAQIGFAVARSFIDEPNHYSLAIDLLQQVIQRHPTSGRAYYNLACLEYLAKKDKAVVLRDLGNAVKHAPRYRVFALHDQDLAPLKNDPEFKAIIVS